MISFSISQNWEVCVKKDLGFIFIIDSKQKCLEEPYFQASSSSMSGFLQQNSYLHKTHAPIPSPFFLPSGTYNVNLSDPFSVLILVFICKNSVNVGILIRKRYCQSSIFSLSWKIQSDARNSSLPKVQIFSESHKNMKKKFHFLSCRY